MIRDAVRIFLLSFLIIYNFINISFAKEYVIDQTYKITYDPIDGVKFHSKHQKTSLTFFKDLYWDFSNGYCKAAAAENIYANIAQFIHLERANNRYYNEEYGDIIYKLCGADWLVWGNEEVENLIEQNNGCENSKCTAYENTAKYYPTLGDFNGSKKYAVKRCIMNPNDCADIVKANKCQVGENEYTCIPVDNNKNFGINDRIYRENLYDGEEIINYACEDPRDEAKQYDIFRNRADGKVYQTYYMRGYEAGNYACDRYLLYKKKTGDEFDMAYRCCKKAEKSVCVYDYEQFDHAVFCSIDATGICRINNVELIIYKAADVAGDNTPRYCAETYNLCPYNFTIESGSEIADEFKRVIDPESQEDCEKEGNIEECDIKYIEDDCKDANGDVYNNCLGNIKNFYQYRRHCVEVVVDDLSTDPLKENYAPFIDKSCINGIGSSHNITLNSNRIYDGYNRISGTYNNIFSANAVECFTETLKNFLFNRAGHTKCKDAAELPDEKENCKSGEVYRKGTELTDFNSNSEDDLYKYPLKEVIIAIRGIVKVFIMFAISLYGFNILIKGGKIGDRRTLVMFLIKISIILTLSYSKFWYDNIFAFTYGVSDSFFNAVSKITFDTTIDQNGNFVNDDGCFFGDINVIKDAETSPEVLEALEQYPDNYYDQYPNDRRYMSFFDTLDCKMLKYFGSRGNYGAPNMFKILMYGLLNPFSLGIYIGILAMFAGLLLLIFIIRLVYIFIASNAAVTILLFLSPIMIPLILFKKTSGMFSKWLKNLIGFSLQPMILAAYVSISVMIIDNYSTGEALFVGQGLDNRELVCGYACKSATTGEILSYTTKRSYTASVALRILDNFKDKSEDYVVSGSEIAEDAELNEFIQYLAASVVESIIKDIKNLVRDAAKSVIIGIVRDKTSLENCGKDDIIVDIKETSPLCMMDNIVLVTNILGLFPAIADLGLDGIFTFLRLVCMLFILNMMLNKLSAMTSAIVGSTPVPGLPTSADLVNMAGKIIALFSGMVRIMKRVAGVRTIIPMAKWGYNKASTAIKNLRNKSSSDKE